MELKQEGKLKPKSNQQQTSTSDNEFSLSDTPADRMRKEREKLKNRSVADEYAEKIGSKFGGRRGKQVGRMLGMDVPSSTQTKTTTTEKRKPKLGAIEMDGMDDDDEDEDQLYQETEDERRERMVISSEAASDAIDKLRRNVDEEEEEETGDDEMDEEEMLDVVAKALARKGYSSASGLDLFAESESPTASSSTTTVATSMPVETLPNVGSSTVSSGVKTSGVGGSWSPPQDEQTNKDAYQPKVGTWGAFPRPRNISVAYGGGKRVGAGVKTDKRAQQQSIESTKDKLRAYREKMGIDVQSEKDNEAVIEEALQLASRAMQRGSYGIGVSSLEKVTQYCSTKVSRELSFCFLFISMYIKLHSSLLLQSKLGGKVFLELAMAYEAEGKTDQAIGLYAQLGKSPIEEIKMNASKLLYGLEAMNFMRDEAKLKEFSRKKTAETFIDATGFKDMASNFDKVYNTAYIDLDKGSQYYRMLTENVVRNTREARQVLLKAVSSGEVDRMKVVQAIRSFTRHFDEALEEEKKNEASKNVPVDYAGRPIVSTRRSTQDNLANAIGMDGFVLSKPSQMLDSLNGEWRLQLMADKKGDGVDYFNSTLIWQTLDTHNMAYSSGSKRLRSSSQSGDLNFDETNRILSREGVTANVGMGVLGMILRGGSSTAGEMTNTPQQILYLDSALLITRAIVKTVAADNVKDYFSVWRRVESGTYTNES